MRTKADRWVRVAPATNQPRHSGSIEAMQTGSGRTGVQIDVIDRSSNGKADRGMHVDPAIVAVSLEHPNEAMRVGTDRSMLWERMHVGTVRSPDRLKEARRGIVSMTLLQFWHQLLRIPQWPKTKISNGSNPVNREHRHRRRQRKHQHNTRKIKRRRGGMP